MDVKRRAAQSLISKLQSESDSTRTSALCELRHLTKNDPNIRPVIADEGAIPRLVGTLCSASHSDQDNAAAILLNVSISCPEALMSTSHLLDALSHALTHHTRHQPTAVATLRNLLKRETHRPIIGSKRDIVYALIDIVGTPDSPAKSLKHALKALFALALYPLKRTLMAELGAAKALFGVVENDRRVRMVEIATAVIAQMAGCEESVDAFRRVSGIRVLVDLLNPGSGSGLSARIRKNAVSGLLNLVLFGKRVVVEEIGDFGVGFLFNGLKEITQNESIKFKWRKRAQTLIDILEVDGTNLRELELSPMISIDSSSDLISGSLLGSDSFSHSL